MPEMHVTLRQLRAFEAVARLGSFSRAAEELHITQPTVSKQIRQLTDAIGLPLIEQIGKRLHLTEAGERLHATCADWLRTWGRFEQSIADLKGLKEGKLRICTVSTTKYFMPRVLGPFCREYPGIDIHMEVVNRDRLLDRLARNEDDLYVMGVPPEDWQIESEPLIENPLVLIAPVTHSLVGQSRVPFSVLAGESFIVRERGSGTRMTMERTFQERGVPLNVRMELGSNEALKQAVAGGLGLAVVSRSTLRSGSHTGELVELDVEGFPIERYWYLVHPRGKELSVVARTFREFLREHKEMLLPAQPAA